MRKVLLMIAAAAILAGCGTTKIIDREAHIEMEKIIFESNGKRLTGHVFLPPGYEEGKANPAQVVSGSWTTVKEQMAGSYARMFAEQGYLTLTFDPTGYGESEGYPLYYENPGMKVEDIKAAVTYLAGRPDVDGKKIGAFGVCAGAAYTLAATSEDERIASVVTAASWIHDAEAVKMFYGGEEGVQAKIAAAEKAEAHFKETGEVEYIPAISETDESAAMYGPYDYYLNPQREAIPSWSADQFAVMSWKPWLLFDQRADGRAFLPVSMPPIIN